VDVKADVEQTIQQSLKNILGGAFTQAEAAGLIERAYDPTQPEASNIRRINRAIKELEERAAVKENAASYYELHGTLVGWKNPNPRVKITPPGQGAPPPAGPRAADTPPPAGPRAADTPPPAGVLPEEWANIPMKERVEIWGRK
jgi:hypothetical protein